MVAEHVKLAGDESFACGWRGRMHYLAVHDIVLGDGEVHSDQGATKHTTDIRGLLTFVPAGCRVWGWCQPARRDNSFTALYLTPELLGEDLRHRFESIALRPEVYFSAINLHGTMQKLQAALTQSAPHDRLYVEPLCLLAAIELCHWHDSQVRGERRSAGRLSAHEHKRVCAYIEAHLAADIGLTELAALTGLSRFHFVRAFKRTTGVTPYQHVLRSRVQRAAMLLAGGRGSVSAVAEETGFRNVSHFIRTFRRMTGASPGSMAREPRPPCARD
ncbi:MAG: helix-turn-helix transcriptional regulator [Gammaproteobacteria bacterium]|nr:helix-turn-helix transcriptional regulator [Gammaproteobacteria bacterium]